MIKRLNFAGYKGQRKSYEFKRLNLVTGKNGSGKTTIYEAIHIALTGKHPYLGETFAAIKKQCSSDTVEFGIDTNTVSINRTIAFGEQTKHEISIDGVKTKIKEAEKLIEDAIPSSIMRLDIGKFSKMNDVDRSVLLSELLGSSITTRPEIYEAIMDEFFLACPEADYVLKYGLKTNRESHDPTEFVNAMYEEFKAEKSPAIVEVINSFKDIVMDGQITVKASDALDVIYAGIKAVRDGKAQEKNYLQKTYVELGSTSDIDVVLENKKTLTNEINALVPRYDSLNAAVAVFSQPVPEGTEEEWVNKAAIHKKTMDDANREIEKIDNEIAAHARVVTELSKTKSEIAVYNESLRTRKEIESRVEEAKKLLLDTPNQAPESGDSDEYLNRVISEYRYIIVPSKGKCQTCGTEISDEVVSATKAQKSKAKKAAEKAEAELAVRRNNKKLLATKYAHEARVADAEAALAKHIKNSPQEPKMSLESVNSQMTDLQETLGSLAIRKGELSKAYANALTEDMECVANIEAIRSKRVKMEAYGDEYNVYPSVEAMMEESNTIKALILEKREELKKVETEIGIHEKAKEYAVRVNAVKSANQTASKLADAVRAYKNKVVQEKIYPVLVLVQKYYKKKGDEVAITPNSIGVWRDGVYVDNAAMSSGESLLLMSAVLVSIMEASGMSPKYLFVDAAEIDENNMGILMGVLEKSSMDTIIIAHHMPIAAGDDWNVIRLEG